MSNGFLLSIMNDDVEELERFYCINGTFDMDIEVGNDDYPFFGKEICPLSLSAFFNSIECEKFMLNNGADINRCDRKKRPPTHYASYGGNIECFQVLLNNGASEKYRDIDGYSIMHHAVSNNKIDFVCYVAVLFPDLLCCLTNKLISPLHIAVDCSNIDMVRVLCQLGGNVNSITTFLTCFMGFFNIIGSLSITLCLIQI